MSMDPFIEITLPAGAPSEPPADAAARLPQFMGGPADAAERLSGLKVLIVGGGSIGFEFIQQLARWGVAAIAIVDARKFKRASLITHAVSPDAIGESKAIYSARLAKRLSPRTHVWALEGEFISVPLACLAEFDIVFLATDNLLAEIQVSRACFPLGLPVIHGSVHGETLSGHVRYYGHGGPGAPCVACAFTSEEWTHLNRSTLFSCEGARSGKSPPQEGQATMSVHALCSAIAQLALLQFLRDWLGLGAEVRDRALEYCAYPQQIVTTRLASRADCPCPHTIYSRAAAPRPLAQCALRELGTDARSSFEVDNYCFAEKAICGCGSSQPVQRFVTPGGGNVGACASCGGPLALHPFHSFRAVPAAALGETINRPLHQLGADGARWVLVRCDDEATLFLNNS